MISIVDVHFSRSFSFSMNVQWSLQRSGGPVTSESFKRLVASYCPRQNYTTRLHKKRYLGVFCKENKEITHNNKDMCVISYCTVFFCFFKNEILKNKRNKNTLMSLYVMGGRLYSGPSALSLEMCHTKPNVNLQF